MGFLDRMVCDAHIKDRVLEMMTARGGEEVSIIEKNSFEGSEVNDALLDAMEQDSMSYKGALDRAGDWARAALAPTRARNLERVPRSRRPGREILSRAGYSFAFHSLKPHLYLSCLAHRFSNGPLAPEDVKLCELYTRNDILEHVAKTTTDEALRASIENYMAHVMPGHLETAQAEAKAARDAALKSTGTWGWADSESDEE